MTICQLTFMWLIISGMYSKTKKTKELLESRTMKDAINWHILLYNWTLVCCSFFFLFHEIKLMCFYANLSQFPNPNYSDKTPFVSNLNTNFCSGPALHTEFLVFILAGYLWKIKQCRRTFVWICKQDDLKKKWSLDVKCSFVFLCNLIHLWLN